MQPLYIVTGAAGFLGSHIVRQLQGRGRIKAFVLPADPLDALEDVQCGIVKGDVLDPASLHALFDDAGNGPVYVIHCAGIVDIGSGYSSRVYDVNVNGTKNVAQVCLEHGAKMVYVSSVHAMPPIEKNGLIEPAQTYDPDRVPGLYAKVKAEASRLVLEYVAKGLRACIVQPSGLIGPDDHSDTNLTQFIIEAADGRLPACVKAGYSFVDVRDAAAAIICACENGQDGKSYIVAGPTVSMQKIAELAARSNHSDPVRIEVPLGLVELSTPLTNLYYRFTKEKPLYTAFAVHTLKTQSNFDTKTAQKELGFSCRPIEQTIEDTVAFLRKTFRIDTDCIIRNGKPEKVIKTSKVLPFTMLAAGLFLMMKRKR